MRKRLYQILFLSLTIISWKTFNPVGENPEEFSPTILNKTAMFYICCYKLYKNDYTRAI